MAQPRRSALVPLAARKVDHGLTPVEREAGDRALQSFINGLGGEEALVAALETGSSVKAVDDVLTMMADPRYEGRSFRWMCSQVGITPAEVFAAYKSAAVARGQVRSAKYIEEGTPLVVQDVMRRAAPYEEACLTCGATGSVAAEPTKRNPNPAPVPCENCRGSGRLLFAPELDRQKLALDLGEMIKKSGGMTVQQNQVNIAGGTAVSGRGGLERLQQALSGLSAPTAEDLPPLDVEVTETSGGSDSCGDPESTA